MLQTALELAKEKKHMKTSDILEKVQKRVKRSVNPKKVLSILKTLKKMASFEEQLSPLKMYLCSCGKHRQYSETLKKCCQSLFR